MNQSKQPSIMGVPCGISGLKAEYHMKAFADKLRRCPGDAGFDLYPVTLEPDVIAIGSGRIELRVSTMIHVLIPLNHMGMIVGRSSTIEKLQGADVTTGIIDPGYTGEIKVRVICASIRVKETTEILKQLALQEKAIAQMIIVPFFVPVFQTVKLDQIQSGRGANGFGHTDN